VANLMVRIIVLNFLSVGSNSVFYLVSSVLLYVKN